MIRFHDWFPEIAERETRFVDVIESDDLPAGRYAYIESYCEEAGCSCGNVLLAVESEDGEVLATINYDVRGRQHKGLGMPRAFLDPLNAQSEHSSAFLRTFRDDVLDDAYQARLERHLRQFKERTAAEAARPLAPPSPSRNAPCPCGSGRKYKRCCGGTGGR